MTQLVNPVTKDQLINEFNAVIADTEQLLHSVAAVGGEKAGAMRAGVEQKLAATKVKLRDLQQAAGEKAQAAVKSTDDYVRENPWQAIGIAAGVAAVAAVALGVLLNRR